MKQRNPNLPGCDLKDGPKGMARCPSKPVKMSSFSGHLTGLLKKHEKPWEMISRTLETTTKHKRWILKEKKKDSKNTLKFEQQNLGGNKL